MNPAEYWRGRDWAVAKRISAATVAGLTARNDFEVGVYDQARGVAPRVGRPAATRPAPVFTGPATPTPNPNVPPVIVQPPPVITQPPPVIGYPGPVLYQPGFLEVAATLFGKPVPLDFAVNLERRPAGDWLILGLQFGTSIQVLGQDPGDRRRGYRLSGAGSGIATRVAQLVAARQLPPDPRYLPPPRGPLFNWYGARTSTGVRLLFRNDLNQLGVNVDGQL
ncbi:MAG: hypothetical protein U1A78_41760 [Polyangia bacterium]